MDREAWVARPWRQAPARSASTERNCERLAARGSGARSAPRWGARQILGTRSYKTNKVSGMTKQHKPPFPKQYLSYPPGLDGSKQLLDYAATKGAIHAFTKSLAQHFVSKGIRVNCVAPGPVWTPLNPTERRPEDSVDFGADTPMGRPTRPDEMAPAFVFFASAVDSSYITGEVLTLFGGDTAAS